MKKRRLILNIRNGMFKSCQGYKALSLTEKYIYAGDWRCKISNAFILCTACKEYNDGYHKIKVKIFNDGQIDIFIKYPSWDGKYKTKHFKKHCNIHNFSNMTIALDNYGEITSRRVEVIP